MIKELKIPQGPFDLYDIFGYIVPGLVFVVAMILILLNFGDDFPFKSEILKQFVSIEISDFKDMKDNLPWWLEVAILVTIIALVYTIGHIIASISSLMVDKYLIKKTSGYPYQRLFNLPYNQDFSIGFYKLIVFTSNTFLLILLFSGKPKDVYFYLILICISVLIIIKMILSNSSLKFGAKGNLYLSSTGRIISIPFNLIVKFIEKSFGLNEPFNDDFIREFKLLYKNQFNIEIEKAGTNLYWLSYCYVIEKNEHLKDIIRHFLRLYGFTRNLGIAFYILFIFTIILRLNTEVHQIRLTWICVIFFCFSLILLIRYYYLYYNYYSKFIFRAFSYLHTNK